MKLALKWSLPITVAAMAIAWLSEQAAPFCGLDPSPQPLVELFTNPSVAIAEKVKWAAFAVLVAPVIEEFLFRMCLFNLFRWTGRKILQSGRSGAFPWASAVLSGAVFAAIHFHAVTFPALLFLGAAFAWLYWKSGTIASPMLCHCIFNSVNLALCLSMALFS